MENDIVKGVQTFLDGESHGVVLGAEETGNLGGSDAVGRAGQTDGETVELREKRNGVEVVVFVNTRKLLRLRRGAVHNSRVEGATVGGRGVCAGLPDLLRVLALQSQSLALGDGSNERAIQTTREKDAVRDLSHQSLSYGALESLSQKLVVDRVGGDVGGLDQPLGVVVAGEGVGLAVVDVARREALNGVADGVEALQLRGEVDGAGSLRGAAHVESGDADRISGGDDAVELLVVQDPAEHAVEVFGGIDSMLLVQGDDDLAVGQALERVGF